MVPKPQPPGFSGSGAQQHAALLHNKSSQAAKGHKDAAQGPLTGFGISHATLLQTRPKDVRRGREGRRGGGCMGGKTNLLITEGLVFCMFFSIIPI